MDQASLPLPLGVYSVDGGAPRVGTAIGDSVLDLAAALGDPVFATASLNGFLSRGARHWADTRARLAEQCAAGPRSEHLVPADTVTMHLPVEVADFVDFYSSLEHASNAGKILRPGEEALNPNWRHLPVGYHGRAGTVVVSGADIRRPSGQWKNAGTGAVEFGPSRKLDVEVELGFVVGASSELGMPVSIDAFKEHVFGAVVLVDWSARDIQGWEYVPLGPFLGKSFGTTISPWVIPLAALERAEIPAPVHDPAPLPYLRAAGGGFGYDISLELRVNGQPVSSPSFNSMYWS